MYQVARNPAVRRVAAKLLKLRAQLQRIVTQAKTGYYLGWDQILDRTEAAIHRHGFARAFRRQLGSIDALRRRYEGYKMPYWTAVDPASTVIRVIERDLRPRRR